MTTTFKDAKIWVGGYDLSGAHVFEGVGEVAAANVDIFFVNINSFKIPAIFADYYFVSVNSGVYRILDIIEGYEKTSLVKQDSVRFYIGHLRCCAQIKSAS